MGRSRGGLTSKIHAVLDTNGLPVRPGLTAGEAHDNRLALSSLSRLRSGSMLLADRGYDADWIRAFAIERGAWANVPPRCNRREPINDRGASEFRKPSCPLHCGRRWQLLLPLARLRLRQDRPRRPGRDDGRHLQVDPKTICPSRHIPVYAGRPRTDSAFVSAALSACFFLNRAIELEPDYALAHAYAAACNHTLYHRGGLPEERRLAAIGHARAGIARGQDDAMALTMSGFLLGLDWARAEAAFERGQGPVRPYQQAR